MYFEMHHIKMMFEASHVNSLMGVRYFRSLNMSTRSWKSKKFKSLVQKAGLPLFIPVVGVGHNVLEKVLVEGPFNRTAVRN